MFHSSPEPDRLNTEKAAAELESFFVRAGRNLRREMTQVEVGFSDLQFDIVGNDAGMPKMSQFFDKDNSDHEIMCMDTTQTDIISGLDNSSGPIRFSILKDTRWKPYSEREKQRLEEQNTRRAILVQKELLRCGLILSPYNVPNFDVHRSDVEENKVIGSCHRESLTDVAERLRISCDSEEKIDEDDKFCCEDSKKQYVGKSNPDLVLEYVEAEEKLEELQNSLELAKFHNQLSNKTFDLAQELEKIRVYRKEIEKLTQENNHLLNENRKLYSILSDAD